MGSVGTLVWSGRAFFHAVRGVADVASDAASVFLGNVVDRSGDSHILRRVADCGDGEEIYEVKEPEEGIKTEA